MARERGSGITPPRVVELLKKEVSDKSMLAVSKTTGLGLAAIGRYLKGIGEPTTATLQKLADYFGVTVAWLRGEDPAWFEWIESGEDKKLSTGELNKVLSKIYKENQFEWSEKAKKYPELFSMFFALPREQQKEALSVLSHYLDIGEQMDNPDHPPEN